MDFSNFDFNITKITLACKVPAGTGDVIHNNRPSHGLAINLDGEKKYIFKDDKSYVVKKNDIIFLPQKSNYIVEVIAPGDCYAINFQIDKDCNFSPFILHAKNTIKFFNMFSSAEKSFKSKKYGYIFKCKSELYSIIYLMLHEYNLGYISSDSMGILSPAIKYIHNFYTEKNIDIKYLSMLCGIKEAYFRRIFLKCYGISPIKYINNLKLSRAKEILLQTTYKLEDVAELSGFNNLYWFCRFFKKETGSTPTEFRNKP